MPTQEARTYALKLGLQFALCIFSRGEWNAVKNLARVAVQPAQQAVLAVQRENGVLLPVDRCREYRRRMAQIVVSLIMRHRLIIPCQLACVDVHATTESV